MNLKEVVLDINIISKAIFKEENSLQAKALLDKLLNKNSEILLPSFSRIEFYSLARKKEVINKLKSEKVRKALSFFNKINLNFIYEDKKLLDEAYLVAAELAQTVVYDCVYLALAVENNAPFISADKQFIKKSKKIYSPSYLLSEFKENSF